MEKKGIIVIGGSAGSINTLLKILPIIEYGNRLPVVLVIHRKASHENMLEILFQLKSKLKILEIEDKMSIESDKIYLVPANYHVLIEHDETFTLDYSERINHARPNIDFCMESVAAVYGNKTIGILLTGANNDGANGMKLIREMGGFTIIQQPETCLFPAMPMHAQKLLEPNLILTPEEIAHYINNN